MEELTDRMESDEGEGTVIERSRIFNFFVAISRSTISICFHSNLLIVHLVSISCVRLLLMSTRRAAAKSKGGVREKKRRGEMRDEMGRCPISSNSAAALTHFIRDSLVALYNCTV